ncbi:MAG TPA: NAD(P)/FAD-dependent oxidoreductase [Pyrinomonadaceae bacterium]|nr:NAD(P)/FAD-dependent oxidoreductase [Pyrinomonadaceae bacterium]
MKSPFRGLRGEAPRESYDAVVIGAGVGGLVCANLLARAGLRTLVVEQHYVVGGYCSTFRRRGFTFDAATHFYPLLGNPSTITGRLLAEMGVGQEWVKMDPVDRFHFPDGSDFSVPADFDAYLSKLKAEFPGEAAALDRFFAAVREAYLHGLLRYFRGRETAHLGGYAGLTVREALERHFRDRKLKLLLAADCGHWGSPPSRTSFVFDSMLRLSYFLGNYYPRGGSQSFADGLARSFEARGGHVLLRALARRIVVRGGAACGVEIETGPPRGRRSLAVRAGVVVSNADLLLTLERLLGEEHAGAELLARARAMRPTHPCFLTHLGLSGVPTEALREAAGYHWDSWDAERVAESAFKIFVPTLYEPEMAPPGCHVVIVQKLTEVDYEAVTDWAGHKREVESYVVRRLERVAPGIKGKTVVRLSATAQTSHRFTLNHRGAMLGWEMSPGQLGAGRPAPEGPVGNLHFVGHWTQPGGGVTPVIVSAMRVAELIAGGTPEAAAAGSAR